MKTQRAVAIRLSKLLQEKKMTRYALCRKVAMSESTLHNIINEKCNSINLNTLYLICEGLDITIIEFLNDDLFKKENLEID